MRIVAKLGTSILTAGSDRLDLEAMSRIVGQVVRLRAAGHHVAIVSSGALAAGRHRLARHLPGSYQPSRQAYASVGQSHLMQSWDELFDWSDIVVAQVLLTRRDLSDRLGYLNARNTLRDLLDAGTVPIVNENDAVALDEMLASRIGENDSLSAYVANIIDADLLVMLTDVDGLYDRDPHTHPGAQLIDRIDRIDGAIESAAGGAHGAGTGGMITKLTAARIATHGGSEVILTNGRNADALIAAVLQKTGGTYFPAAASRLESRKRWILGSMSRGGHISVDGGAMAALRKQGRSLLPAGVAAVHGAFERGESIEVRGPTGERVAVGISNYDSQELDQIRGLRSDRIGEKLGYSYGEEAIHRDNLALLD